MDTCAKCGTELTQENSYHSKSPIAYCKPCNRNICRDLHQKNKERYFQNRVKRLGGSDAYSAYKKAWKQANRPAHLAHLAVQNAIRRGELTRPAECSQCGKTGMRIIAHHDDYSKKTTVRWLCDECHSRSHAA